MGSGEVLRLLSTDPAAVIDVPHFCNQSGHEFIGMQEAQGATAYLIRRA